MKKIIPICISLFLLFLFYEFIVVLLVKEYDYKYEFNSNNNKIFNIEEKYKYKDKKHLYDITIKKGKSTYIYNLEHNYHKDKSIIEDLYYFKEKNNECILPVFKDDVYVSPECIVDGKLVSYKYLKQKNIKFEKLEKFLIKKDLNQEKKNRKKTNLSSTSLNLNYYNDILDDYNIIVWNYKGYFSINSKEQFSKDIIDFDIYDSKYLGKSNDKLYIMNASSDDVSFDYIYTIDLKDGSSDKMEVIEYELSTNIYFNGSYKNNMYLLDCSSNKQYKVDLKDEKLIEVSKENNIKYYNGKKLINQKLDSIANNNIKFKEGISNNKIEKLYNTEEIKKSNNHYYIKDKEGNFYRITDDNSILLFNMKDLEEWSVVDDTIFGIKDDKLYAYNDAYGLYPIIEYSEFAYRKKNMYGVARK